MIIVLVFEELNCCVGGFFIVWFFSWGKIKVVLLIKNRLSISDVWNIKNILGEIFCYGNRIFVIINFIFVIYVLVFLFLEIIIFYNM